MRRWMLLPLVLVIPAGCGAGQEVVSSGQEALSSQEGSSEVNFLKDILIKDHARGVAYFRSNLVREP